MMRRVFKLIDGLSFGLFAAYAVQQLASMLLPQPRLPKAPGPRRIVVLIPALNEASVIATTLQKVRQRLPEAQIVVIDDASDDNTAQRVEALAQQDAAIRCLRRTFPQARENKARAMNWAIGQLRDDGTLAGDTHDTIVVGLDADGWLDEDFAAKLGGAFADPQVMAAQGWMRYRQETPQQGGYRDWLARTLLLQQDLENYVLGQTQYLRHRLATPVMTGSGQCFRASYLLEQLAQGTQPWPDVLLEDFASTVEVKKANSQYRVAFMDTIVQQQGTIDPISMVRQRARWNQGTMECLGYLPDVARTSNLATLADFTYLLLGPWLLIVMVLSLGSGPLRRKMEYQGLPAPFIKAQTMLPVGIQLYWTLRYVRERKLPLWMVLYAFATMPVVGLINTASLPLAYYRYFSGQKTWYKSNRHAETPDFKDDLALT